MTAQYGVGQRVILVERTVHRRTSPREVDAVVTKVGRTLVTARSEENYPGEIRFRMETGVERSDWPGWCIYTPEELADEQRRKSITAKLLEHGVRVATATGYGDVKLSTDALAQILAVVAEDRRLS